MLAGCPSLENSSGGEGHGMSLGVDGPGIGLGGEARTALPVQARLAVCFFLLGAGVPYPLEAID